MCAELDKILERPPPCGCNTFICAHTPALDLKAPTAEQLAAALRRWMGAEKHRWECDLCRREERAARRAIGRRHFMKLRAAMRIFDESRRRPFASFRRPR